MRSAPSRPPGLAVKLAATALIVAAGDWIFYQRDYQGGQIGLLAFALLAALLVCRPDVRRDRRSWLAMGASGWFAGALVYEPGPLALGLFWIFASVATLVPATTRRGDGWRWAQRIAWHSGRTPIAPLLDGRRWLRVRAAGRAGRWTLHGMVGLLAMPMLGSAIILALFAAANPVLERALSTMAWWDVPPDLVGRCLLWGVLFAPIWSLLRPRLARQLLPLPGAASDLRLAGVSAASVTLSLALFNLLFAAQNLMDLAYLGHLAPLPEGMTLPDYAHRGAYPLIATALLAALFVLVILRPGSSMARDPCIRRLVMLWIGQNILLVASSMLRTMDYIGAYSLTRLRVAALVWMALVAFGLATICWRIAQRRSAAWLIDVNLAAVMLILAVACYADTGAIAAHWNVRHAREVGGPGAPLDLRYLDGLEDAALLPLLELEARSDLPAAFAAQVRVRRVRLMSALEQDQAQGWTLLGAWRLAAARAIIAQRPARRMPAVPPPGAGAR